MLVSSACLWTTISAVLFYGMKLQFLVVVLAAGMLAGCSTNNRRVSAPNAAATKPAHSPPLIVDVRSAEEYQSGHLPNAINIPVATLENGIQEIAPAKDTPLMVHCQGGGRSARAYKKLQELGYTNVRDLGSFEAAKAELDRK